MMGHTVVYIGPPDAADAARRALGSRFTLRCVEPERRAVEASLRDAYALIDASMRVRIDEDIVAGASKLKVISTVTTGSSHIDSRALESRGIGLLTLKDQTDLLAELTPAAEHSWLLLLACARGLRSAINDVDRGVWERERHPGTMVKGKTLGIIGLGRIGGWMARYATAFGMRVLATDPERTQAPCGGELVSLETLLQSSDFISLHVHLSESTRGMIGPTQLSQVKHGAILINTSRGELLDEEAVIDALDAGTLAGVGVDVLWDEPNPGDSPLWRRSLGDDRVTITPHIGGFAPETVQIVVEHAARRVTEYGPT